MLAAVKAVVCWLVLKCSRSNLWKCGQGEETAAEGTGNRDRTWGMRGDRAWGKRSSRTINVYSKVGGSSSRPAAESPSGPRQGLACYLFVSFASNGSASLFNTFGRTIILYFECSCDFSSVMHTRETKQFEQLDVECTTLIICHNNHRVGVPMFFEDWELCHNLWQSLPIATLWLSSRTFAYRHQAMVVGCV